MKKLFKNIGLSAILMLSIAFSSCSEETVSSNIKISPTPIESTYYAQNVTATPTEVPTVTPTITPQPTYIPIPEPTKAAISSNAEDKKEITVYVTRTGEKYHRGGCRYLRKSQIPMDLIDARRSYSACSICNPPE